MSVVRKKAGQFHERLSIAINTRWRLFRVAVKLRQRRRYLLRSSFTAYATTRHKIEYRTVAVLSHKFGDVEVMPPLAPPAMCGQAVVGIIQIGESIEGERLHATSIAHDFVQAML